MSTKPSVSEARKVRAVARRFRKKYGGHYADPFFSPDENADQVPIGFMRKCKGYLDIAVYSITHEEIAREIVAASKRLRRVRVVMDKVQAAGRYSQASFLEDSGVCLLRDAESGLMHLKIALDYDVVTLSRTSDGKPHRRRVAPRAMLLGSYNWTKGATERNRENQLVVRVKKVVAGHLEVFEDIWESSDGYEAYPHTRL